MNFTPLVAKFAAAPSCATDHRLPTEKFTAIHPIGENKSADAGASGHIDACPTSRVGIEK